MVRKILTPKNVFVIYFITTSCAIMWLMINAGSNCDLYNPLTDDYAYPREDRHSENTASKLLAWQHKLILAERHLRKTYPDHAQEKLQLDDSDELDIPVIYAITPTYARPTQKAELTRLANTFLHVPNFHWIVVEDWAEKTSLVTNLLRGTGLKYTHLSQETPPNYKMQSKDPNWLKPRGVLQRNAALHWLREHIDLATDKGVIYFADDDNTYSTQLFEEMRWTKKVSVWPVGLVGYLKYEAPVVKNNKVTGWHTYWRPDRPFAMDMAGFAVNIRELHEHPTAQFKLEVERGNQESELLTQLTTLEDLEPKADNCTKVLVWHTRTEKANLKNEDKFKAQGYRGSDPSVEV